MTVSEVIYYTGVHPYTLQPIKTPKTPEEKQNQNRFFFWYKPEMQKWIKERLLKINRNDLVDKLLGKRQGPPPQQQQHKSNTSPPPKGGAKTPPPSQKPKQKPEIKCKWK